MPVGPCILWPEKARKSAPRVFTSVTWWGTDWAPSTTTTAPCRWAASAMRRHRVDGAEHVGHRGDRHAPWPPPSVRSRSAEVEPALAVDRQVAQLEAERLGQHQPRDEVGVVLHLGEHDDVAAGQVGAAPAVGDQVERLGRVLREDDLALGVRGADEPPDRPAGPLVERGGALGGRVDAPVHVGVGGLVVVVHGGEHRRGWSEDDAESR